MPLGAQEKDSEKARILIVEDDLHTSTILGKLLRAKGYIPHILHSGQEALDLFQSDGIRLFTPKRLNQYNYHKYPALFQKLRRRIETLFSQLCDQFMIKRNYAKSFLGLVVRIISKIVALTMAQYQNKFYNNKPINEIKYAFS